MNVLVVESNVGAGEETARTLEAAGHRAITCFERGMESFPCRALFAGGACPLDEEPIDVVLLVRAHPWPSPTSRERGVPCALRAGVPLVVAGQVVFDPYERWAAEQVDGTVGVVEACERVAQYAKGPTDDGA